MTCMRRAAATTMVVTLVIASAVLASSSAYAQARDPFRPPPGAGGSTFDGAPSGGPAPAQPLPAEPSGGLARTGQDVAMLFAFGLAVLTIGVSLSLAGRIVPGSPHRA